MRRRGLVVLAALAACGDNGAPAIGDDGGGVEPPPPAGDFADFEEGPEPNGLGVIEASLAPAGIATMKPITNALVLHGHVAPFEDADGDGALDPDVDTWRIHVAAPMRVRIAIEGAGFRIHVPGYERFGVAVTGPAVRGLYLPIAGDYELSIASSQTWIPAGAAGAGAYTATLEQLPAPLAPVLGFDAGVLAVDTSLVYTAQLGEGFNLASLAIDDDRVRPALTLVRRDQIIAASDRARRVELVAHGDQGDSPVTVIAEPLYSLATGPVAYEVSLRTSSAHEMPRHGEQLLLGPTPTDAHDLLALGQLYFDTFDFGGGGGVVEALSFTFDRPVRAAIYGDDLAVPLAEFGGLGTTSPTLTTYTGVINLAHAGRYSLVYYAPTGDAVKFVSATQYSSHTLAPDAGSLDTLLPPELPIAGILYEVGAPPIQQVDNSAGLALAFYATNELGRIQPVATSAGVLPGRTPLWSYSTGSSHLVSYFGELATQFLLVVTPTGVLDGERFDVDVSDFDLVDLGLLGAGASLERSAQVYDSASPGYAGVHAAPGTPISIAVTGTVHVHQLDRLGNTIATDPATIVQDASGWTAVAITPIVEEQATPYTLTFSTP